jgi:hypothetical protein
MPPARSLSRFERALAMTRFNIVTWVELDKAIAFPALQAAVEELAAHHPGMQLSLNAAHNAFVPFRSGPACTQVSGEADTLIAHAPQRPFVAGEALWRIDLPVDASPPALLLTCHHVMMDGEAKLHLIHDLLAFLGQGSPIPRRTMAVLEQPSSPRQILRALRLGVGLG